MKYNSSPYDDEIDLIASIKIIWNGKKKILLITIISFLVGFGYNYQLPKNYLHSLTIKPGNTFEIAKLDNIQKLLNLIQTNQSNLDRFIKELEDYEELSESLKNTTKVKKNFITNKIEDQEIELFKYVRLFKIHKLSGNEIGYTINFEWHDSYEAKKVLKNT